MKLEKIKDLIQSCNFNFLIGSGASRPYLSTLEKIENLLTEVNKQNPANKELIQASLYNAYCRQVIFPNLESELENYTKTEKYLQYFDVLENYSKLLTTVNNIILLRHNNLLTKRINLFTTNIDIFLEKALEDSGLEFNDGFKGRINPIFDLSNFQKSYSKTSSHYDNVSEIPVFNLLKLHGSINWELNSDEDIKYSPILLQVESTKSELDKIPPEILIEIKDDSDYAGLVDKAGKIERKFDFTDFLREYNKLLIVNPTKEKFQRTLFDEYFYEMMRIYANALEKQNSILFVMGFSFADEHIKLITLRAANSNPTLQIIIFAFKKEDVQNIKDEIGPFRNNNISVIDTGEFINANVDSDDEELANRLINFDCKSIEEDVFSKIKSLIGSK